MALINDSGREDEMNELKLRLKQHMDPEMFEDDLLFYRFLAARDFNVDQAETMLNKHLEWRQQNDMDNIFNWKQPEVLEKYMPYVFLGYDKEGCPVQYFPCSTIDWNGILLSVRVEEIEKRGVQNLEEDIQRMKEQSKKLGKTGIKCLYILNSENLSLAQTTSKNVLLLMISHLNTFINNYPEVMKSAYVINANSYFSFIFSLAKRCLPNSIIHKIKVYSDDSWKTDLLEVIDAEVLPEFLGGNKTDPDSDPFCNVNQGGHVPESYYTHKSKRSLSVLPEVEKVSLSSASFHEVKLEVKEPGSYLEWEFETKTRDIGFGLFRQQEIDGKVMNIEVIPLQRINTDEFAETGLYLCEKEGTYVIVFDNTYSWVRTKELYYRVKIVSPQEQES